VSGGPAERELEVLARRYSALTLTIASAGCVLLGLVVVPPGHDAGSIAEMVGLLTWFAAYPIALLRWPTDWPVAATVAMVCVAALTQGWTVSAVSAADGSGWVLAVVTISAMAMQWQVRSPAGAAATGLLVAAYFTGAWLAVGAAELHRLPMLLWVIPETVLSRVCYAMLRRAANQSDALFEGRQRRRGALAVSAARRADEREQQALLHDTVAATLLMVGLGAVPAQSQWLAEQAARDLQVLQHGGVVDPPVDLADLIAVEILRSPIPVRLDTPPPRFVLPVPVARALARAIREALHNVAQHAGVDHAALEVCMDPPRVDIVDTGCGFDLDRVSPHRLGLARSIVARMAAAGGRATVSSAPGQGTLVRLEWPRV
jgi:signal transduction histidine kinase